MKKISIICVVRNDDYGMYQVERTIAFLKSLNEIPNKNSYEIVFVEWNPIIHELSFYDKYIDYIPEGIDIKFVIVSEDAHKSIENPNNLPVFEYYGKNVGARQSSGEFLIFTNPDNVFFPQTWIDIEYSISNEHFLRLCRADVKFTNNEIIYNTTGDETIKQLMKNNFIFYYAPASELTDAKSYEELVEGFIWDINHEGASGDFFGISKENYYKIKGYREFWTYGGFDGIICRDAKSIGLKQFILPKYSVHIDHERPHLHTKPGTNIYYLELNKFNDENWGLNSHNGISFIDYHIKK
jgi:hypothetical protein